MIVAAAMCGDAKVEAPGFSPADTGVNMFGL
jgi:hypothetical protein